MTTYQKTILQGNQTTDAGPHEYAQGEVTVQDAARSGPGVSPIEHNGSNGHSPETVTQAKPAHRPFSYPAWPTSQPGPQATLPPPGQHPLPLRTDQMMYGCYDQERGEPCTSPLPAPVVQQKRARSYLPTPHLLGVETSGGEEIARWLDDGGREDHGSEQNVRSVVGGDGKRSAPPVASAHT